MVFLLSVQRAAKLNIFILIHFLNELAHFGQFFKWRFSGPHFFPISAAKGPHLVPISLKIRSPLGPHEKYFGSPLNVGAVHIAHLHQFWILRTRPKSCFGGVNERWAATLFVFVHSTRSKVMISFWGWCVCGGIHASLKKLNTPGPMCFWQCFKGLVTCIVTLQCKEYFQVFPEILPEMQPKLPEKRRQSKGHEKVPGTCLKLKARNKVAALLV